MRYAIRHETRFVYEAPMHFARCNVRLRPISWPGQSVRHCELSALPVGHFTAVRSDPFLVNLDRLVVDHPVSDLTIVSEAIVVVDREIAFSEVGDLDPANLAQLARDSNDATSLSPAGFIYPSPLIPINAAITDWCALSLQPRMSGFDLGMALALRINREFNYRPGVTHVMTDPRDAFIRREGVCQDFAQIMIAGLRGMGLAAGYASGYLRTVPPEGEARLTGADATHAWAMLWCGPARGWIGFDPTNGIVMAGDHILVAMGRDYADVAPVDGIFVGAGDQALTVCVDVVPQD
jgi:transglutaminase-like putative cysteine protease